MGLHATCSLDLFEGKNTSKRNNILCEAMSGLRKLRSICFRENFPSEAASILHTIYVIVQPQCTGIGSMERRTGMKQSGMGRGCGKEGNSNTIIHFELRSLSVKQGSKEQDGSTIGTQHTRCDVVL
jgi:hypothetical protein